MATSCGFESHRPHHASPCRATRRAAMQKPVRAKRVRHSLSAAKATTDCAARSCPTGPADTSDVVSHPMKLFREEHRILGCFSVLLLLGGCGGPEPECDSVESRKSVVKIVSDDSDNPLVNYAVKDSSSVAAMVSDAKSEAQKSTVLEKARRNAVYVLDETIRVRSRNRAARSVDCSGLLSVTVGGDTTAQKEIDFKVELTTDGATSVSVSPFLF
jgi:hypothetical protein